MEPLYYALAFILGIITDIIIHYVKKKIDYKLEREKTKQQRKDDLIRWLLTLHSTWEILKDLENNLDITSEIITYIKEANNYLASFTVYANTPERKICIELQKTLNELGKTVTTKPLNKNKVNKILEKLITKINKLQKIT